MFLKKISIFVLALFLLGCIITSPKSNLQIGVDIAEPDRIRFLGKGAGAGVMLSSSMGPVGIAIGVAIDEGISKDIDKAAREKNFDIRNTLLEAFYSEWEERRVKANLELIVERYGFVTRPGDNDLVAPQIHLSIIQQDGSKEWFKYPEDYPNTNISTRLLDELKRDGTLSVRLMGNAAQFLSEKILEKY